MNFSSFSLNGSTDSTENETQTLEDRGDITVETVIKLFMCAMVALVSFIGNIIVIFVVFKTKTMHTNTYFLIVNMSISDLLYTVIAMPSFIAGILGHALPIGSHWGTFICKFINAAAFGLIASSVLTLAAISCDRFFAIVYSLKKLNTKRYLKYIIISIWVCSILVMSPMLYAMRLVEEGGFVYCTEDWSPFFDTDTASRAYTIALFIVIYMVPFTSMLIFYSLISHFLWFRKVPGNGTKSSKRRAMTSRRKVIRMLLTLVLCFIICWLPLQIVTFFFYFDDTELPMGFYFSSEFLIRANGAVNPIIYAVFNEKFRRGFKSFLFCTTNKQLSGNTLSFTPSSKFSNNYIQVKRISFRQETQV